MSTAIEPPRIFQIEFFNLYTNTLSKRYLPVDELHSALQTILKYFHTIRVHTYAATDKTLHDCL